MLFGIGFQGPFQLQTNQAAARAGALWQKFFRRGAKIRFGDEKTVVDIHATFTDPDLGSCGEISEWIEGRTWRLEVDDNLDALVADSAEVYQIDGLAISKVRVMDIVTANMFRKPAEQ